MRYKERIEIDPHVLAGKPIIKGTHISVEFILELLANGWDIAAIEYSLQILKEEKVFAI
jgi:uncharacterized protein (DUF433 family)